MLLERYRVVGLLGRGGMGEVYRAEDLKLGQVVALKFLPPGIAGDDAALARFHREVRIARQVSHPNESPCCKLRGASPRFPIRKSALPPLPETTPRTPKKL
jgi:serine/threonine protein kinase